MKFTSAEVIVQRQLEACNTRDADALLATYAQDAHEFEFPGRLLASGHAQIRARVDRMLADPLFRVRLVQRSVMGNVVVDHQDVDRTLADGPGQGELIAIYVVDRGLIRTVSFLFGAQVLHARQRFLGIVQVGRAAAATTRASTPSAANGMAA
jgi:hypothetical protein